jgi:hypothetical protein
MHGDARQHEGADRRQEGDENACRLHLCGYRPIAQGFKAMSDVR